MSIIPASNAQPQQGNHCSTHPVFRLPKLTTQCLTFCDAKSLYAACNTCSTFRANIKRDQELRQLMFLDLPTINEDSLADDIWYCHQISPNDIVFKMQSPRISGIQFGVLPGLLLCKDCPDNEVESVKFSCNTGTTPEHFVKAKAALQGVLGDMSLTKPIVPIKGSVFREVPEVQENDDFHIEVTLKSGCLRDAVNIADVLWRTLPKPGTKPTVDEKLCIWPWEARKHSALMRNDAFCAMVEDIDASEVQWSSSTSLWC